MSKTLLIDVERSAASVQDEIDSGQVVRVDARDYKTVDSLAWEFIYDKQPKYDAVVLDSLVQLWRVQVERAKAHKTPLFTQDGPGMVEKYMFDLSASEPEWGFVGSAITKLLWNFKEGLQDKAVFIFTCGEQDRPDGPGKVATLGPDLNPQLRAMVLHFADCVGRLGILTAAQDLVDLDGKKKNFAPGTRVLRVDPASGFHAKARVRTSRWESGKFLSLLPNPTLKRLYENLGVVPEKILLYGAPGVGKTTLACSEGK